MVSYSLSIKITSKMLLKLGGSDRLTEFFSFRTLILTTSLRDKDKTGYRYESGDEFDVQHHSLALFIISKRNYGSMVELTSSSEWLELH